MEPTNQDKRQLIGNNEREDGRRERELALILDLAESESTQTWPSFQLPVASLVW